MALIILNIIFFLSFLVFTYLNFNDPDAWLWVPIYASATICCGLVVFNKFYPVTYLFLIVFYMVYAIILFFSKDGVRDWIRFVREGISYADRLLSREGNQKQENASHFASVAA